MSWNQFTLDVPDDLIDVVVGELSGDGVAGVWESHSPAPGLTRLVLYFDRQCNLEQVQGTVSAVFERLHKPAPSISSMIVEERDWMEEWKKSYTSFPISSEFFVIPSWENPVCPDDRLPIRIDPGQAFGTGTHETTQMTMEALARWVEPEHVVLDVGTGSGILAIASRLLGAKLIFACDNDTIATQVARANIERNAQDSVFTFCGSLECVKTASAGLALGNLTADVIVDLLPDFHRVLVTQGMAIFSGILIEQAEEVRTWIVNAGFIIHEEITQGEWLALVVEKHGP